MHTVFALLCFVVVIHWLIFPYPSGLLHWHCGNLTIAPVPAKQPWWIWINTSFDFIMNDYITTTEQSTTKPCAYFLGYTVDHPAACFTDHDLFKLVTRVKSLCPIKTADKWEQPALPHCLYTFEGHRDEIGHFHEISRRPICTTFVHIVNSNIRVQVLTGRV